MKVFLIIWVSLVIVFTLLSHNVSFVFFLFFVTKLTILSKSLFTTCWCECILHYKNAVSDSRWCDRLTVVFLQITGAGKRELTELRQKAVATHFWGNPLGICWAELLPYSPSMAGWTGHPNMVEIGSSERWRTFRFFLDSCYFYTNTTLFCFQTACGMHILMTVAMMLKQTISKTIHCLPVFRIQWAIMTVIIRIWSVAFKSKAITFSTVDCQILCFCRSLMVPEMLWSSFIVTDLSEMATKKITNKHIPVM